MKKIGSKLALQWFDLRVFYVRISNFSVEDDQAPEFLTLNHIPLCPDTLLEVNGSRCTINSEGISSILRRDRIDKKSEEATYVSTDGIRFTGSVKFEVFDDDELPLLFGFLENDFNGESEWSMDCELAMAAAGGFMKGKQNPGSETTMLLSPRIEVYVAGCFLGKPAILTRSLQIGSRKKQNYWKGMLHSIPEYDTVDSRKNVALQVVDYRSYRPESEEDYSMYWGRTQLMEGEEDGELSWFNAGVRVGVGIGLGVGIGVGLLVRTYQATARSFRRRLP
ncbi:uncharacterized protein At1g01500-like [Diospyros lotus]|uniref:uncharacterized protein At1g01500-like n=1 Tax=Diospyros lotus TaxID=55363 RepID=UPI002253384A|nr:uncharacterized protein At1g01500-like [Diospyros lotus]